MLKSDVKFRIISLRLDDSFIELNEIMPED